MHPQSLHDFSAMTFHCLNAELELLGNVAGAVSFGHQTEDLDLA